MAHNKLAILGIAGYLLVALPTGAQTSRRQGDPSRARNVRVSIPKQGSVDQTAHIAITASTSKYGYFISVGRDGSFSYFLTDRAGHLNGKGQGGPQDTGLAKRFYRDLNAALPLSQLAVRHRLKGVSFGAKIFVTYKGQKSPDLTSGGDTNATNLRRDIQAIVRNLSLRGVPRPAQIH